MFIKYYFFNYRGINYLTDFKVSKLLVKLISKLIIFNALQNVLF